MFLPKLKIYSKLFKHIGILDIKEVQYIGGNLAEGYTRCGWFKLYNDHNIIMVGTGVRDRRRQELFTNNVVHIKNIKEDYIVVYRYASYVLSTLDRANYISLDDISCKDDVHILNKIYNPHTGKIMDLEVRQYTIPRKKKMAEERIE